MEQLSGIDALFLHQEQSNAPMHIAPFLVYDPSTAPGGFVRYKDILRTFEKRLHRSSVFRRKLVEVPFSLDQPYWIEDPDFDLEFHVRHIALPKPGDWRQLCILISRLHARPLDRSRPLWEAYVIEGLDNIPGTPPGSFGILLKIHHAAIDGASGTEIIGAIHDLTPEIEPEPADKPWIAERDPSSLELLTRAWVNNIKQPFKIMDVLGQTVPMLKRINDGKKQQRFKSLGEKARTRFNGKVSPHRVYGAVEMSLADVKTIRNAAVDGVTVNDVMLSVVGGGMQRYLAAHEEKPEHSLCAFAPINTRGNSKADGGNKISMMVVDMMSDIADPIERLNTVHQGAVESKAYHNAVGASTLTDISQSMPASLMALGSRAVAASGMMANMKPVANTVVTNVPGPQFPLYMGGAKLVKSQGVGLVLDGCGLFHPVTSYNGMITITFQACRLQMPDPEFYAECLQQSFDEMLSAATPKKTRKKAPAKPRARKTAAKKPAAKSASRKAVPKRKTTSKRAATKPESAPAEQEAASA
jgi:WS/DGAT/MGAT family acyltransferase